MFDAGCMTLGQLIEALEKADGGPVEYGFGMPMSYRGYYNELAFEPVRDTTVEAMLDHARWALGRTFEGYKGGDYKMDADTDCWIAEYSRTGVALSELLLGKMLGTEADSWRKPWGEPTDD